ncbi:hypothetical protein LAZ67_3002596 [Cordylochernes scorpioides]|uniref:Uncharacterized protein n=1 Tax=Cordylochernes scorpioides TaxID=51811 RepID=A0ABY6KBA1_9ARAC|nr:hypothetical protein LAZ67_3002596 [Cordylochernes scorpioides]
MSIHKKNENTVELRKFREQIKVELGAKDGDRIILTDTWWMRWNWGTTDKLEYSLDAQAVRRSRRLQGLEPEENISMVKQETQTKMGQYHFQPFRNPSIFTGERNKNPEKWLK